MDHPAIMFNTFADYPTSKVNTSADHPTINFNSFADYPTMKFNTSVDCPVTKFNGFEDYAAIKFKTLADYPTIKFKTFAVHPTNGSDLRPSNLDFHGGDICSCAGFDSRGYVAPCVCEACLQCAGRKALQNLSSSAADLGDVLPLSLRMYCRLDVGHILNRKLRCRRRGAPTPALRLPAGSPPCEEL